MAKQVINIGAAPNDNSGDPLRDAFIKSNDNFTELYDGAGLGDDSVTYAKLGTEFTTSAAVAATDLDFSTAQVFTKTISGDTTFTFSNTEIGMVKDFVLTGGGAAVLTFPTGSKIASGEYDGTVSNLFQILVVGAADYWITISQEVV